MASDWEPYEQLERYPVGSSQRAQLLEHALECSVVWTGEDGAPMGVIHWFVWHDGRFFVTSGTHRPRVAALRARPQSCVIVSGAGTSVGANVSVSARTLATVHDDEATLRWFAAALSAKAHAGQPAMREQFEQMLTETSRVVIELDPHGFVSYDGAKMAAALTEAGKLDTIDATSPDLAGRGPERTGRQPVT